MTDTFTASDDRALAEWLGLPVRAGGDPRFSEYHNQQMIVPYLAIPTPTTDYAVLEAVRKRSGLDICRVRDAVKLAWEHRAMDFDKEREPGTQPAVWGCTQYQPGDYARAAYAVMREGE